jgi:hypothetical protein
MLTSPQSGRKHCLDCGELKGFEEFPRTPRRRDGRGSYCKVCFSIRYRKYRERKAARAGRVIREPRDVPDGMRYCPTCEQTKALEEFPRSRSASQGRGAYCKPCHNERGKRYLERVGGSRDYHLRRRYGLTSADVDAMIAAQGSTCATCDGKPEHVDHDHATGKVRGVLCFNCNQALGNVRDSMQTLTRLRSYLGRQRPTVDEVLSPFEIELADYLERHRAG